RHDLHALVDVVAKRNQIDARLAELAIGAGGDPRAADSVFPIGDDNIDPFTRDQDRHGALHHRHTWRANNVPDEQYSHERVFEDTNPQITQMNADSEKLDLRNRRNLRMFDSICGTNHRANSTARVSRTTVTLISPG